MMDLYILNDDGEPERCADTLRWAQWMELPERIVLQTQCGDLMISTVFLGINHRFFGGGLPVLWETMVFDRDRAVYYEHTRRYTSKLDALTGHREVMVEVEAAQSASIPRGTKKL
jgi:hypothetical protein